MQSTITLHNKDCWEAIKEMPDNSVEAIITDPPYDIGFMGKGWDKKSLITNVEFWKECYRVLKCGGHLLSFGHSRTSHRTATAIEDAGFEIRDTIMWIYGSGFPKSHNVGKAIDKKNNSPREVVGDNPNHRESDALFELGFQGGKGDGKITKGNSEWEGWGTALKPAHEPIILARKPLEGTIAANCEKWGVGALNIDACRVGDEVMPAIETKTETTDIGWEKAGYTTPERTGRFPANIMFDEEAAVILDEQSGKTKSSPNKVKGKYKSSEVGENTKFTRGNDTNYTDSGGASRFFYCAKVNKKERNKGLDAKIVKNNHPTVKPIAVMEWLIKLVSREGHTVLDPFMGSGSTGIAAKNLGRNFIGCEREKDYYEIAKTRIENW